MVLEGGIYNSRNDDSCFIIIKKEKHYVFGFDIGIYNGEILTQTFLFHEIQNHIDDIQIGIKNDQFWYADEADTIVDGYLGKINTNWLEVFETELYYSDAYDEVGEYR